ncbi:MAG: fused MFS/spermidine synthase [Nitrospirota bacterium]
MKTLKFTLNDGVHTGNWMKTDNLDLKIVVFFSGVIIMVLEILGFRILAPYFGYSVYVSGSLIGIIMTALSLGYFLGGKLADRKPQKQLLFQLILLADVYLILITVFYSDLIEFLAHFGLIYGSILSSVILFGPSMILLGMVPPFIIKLMTRDASIVGSIAGNITAIGTIGSIVGTFGATFILIPKIGSHLTMCVSSTVLLIIALWGLVFKRKEYMVLVFLVFLLGFSTRQTDPDIIFQKETPYNLIKVTQERNGDLILKLNSDLWAQSIYRPDSNLVGGYFDYFNVAPIISDAKEILILGMGAGTSAKQYLHYFDVNVDAVEIDPGIIETGKMYFGLNESSRLHIFAEDARPFLQKSDKKYDVIELDVYHGGIYAPFYVLTKEFFESIHEHLNPNGVMAVNVICTYEKEKRTLLVNAVGKTLSTVFPSIYKIEMFQNYLLLVTKSPTDLNMLKGKLRSYDVHPELEEVVSIGARVISELNVPGDSTVLTDDKSPVAEITYRMMAESLQGPYSAVH